MTHSVAKPGHGEQIIREGIATPTLQLYLDEIEEKLNSFLLGDSVIFPEWTVATLPSVTKNKGGQINVTDEVGGYVPAFSDGTNWRRVTDRIVVS